MTVPALASPHTPQWLFDKDGGLHAPAERYPVAPDRLSETRLVDGKMCYCVPLHLAEKEWVRMADLWPAFGAALLNSGHPINPTIWAATYEAAEREAAKVQAYSAERERPFAADPMSRFTPMSIQELRA